MPNETERERLAERERFRRAEELFHAALERRPDDRRSFLDEACGSDVALRRQVELLVSSDGQAAAFLEQSIVAPLVDAAPPGEASLVGRQFGPYRILSLLGAGGMGEVYRARDESLGRDVAIKTLPAEFARDPGRLARFRREARTLAALNHPNIAAIYALEQSPGFDYLVLELVEGDALQGPLPLATALDLSCQVADALQAAHEHGIVHRDLKPANVKVTPAGRVKVLDFGLAKTIRESEATLDGREPAGGAGTRTGQLLGTPGYMSPEQARGADVDQRTDVWAFGCLLYELLAGRRAFAGESVADTLAAALDREPDWHALPDSTPPGIFALVRQCLQKDASRRPGSMADARAATQIVRGGQATVVADISAAPADQAGRSALVRAVAVLPLVNLGGGAEQDYFADGMTEALIAELAQIHALRVTSRTSVMHYKGTTKTLPEIARELGLDAIVEGSVLRAGDRVRISAQLIDAASDRHLWAQSYERPVQDVLRLQSEVARAVAAGIQVTLTPQEQARLARARPVNLEAHEAYIRGRYHWGRVHPAQSIEHFQRAIALDPGNALAYAGIADAHCMMFGGAMEAVPPTEAAPLARAAALKALELDESLAEPHIALARVQFWHDRDAAGAERELCRAIELNPSCALAHFHRGVLFADVGRGGEAAAAFEAAMRLDPVSCWNGAIAGLFLWELGMEDAGKQQLQKALELDPTFFFPWSGLALVHASEGQYAKAVAEGREGVRLSSGLPMARAWAAYVLAIAGCRAEAEGVVKELDELARERYVPAAAWAWCYLGLGDEERTLEWLEAGYRQRDSQLPHAGLLREFQRLRPDPRFQDLLRRLGLPA